MCACGIAKFPPVNNVKLRPYLHVSKSVLGWSCGSLGVSWGSLGVV
jgi:hypothetical protein